MTTVSVIDIGATNISTLGVVTTGSWNATLIPLTKFSLGLANTANNGGFIYSTASVLTVHAATATAGQLLLSAVSIPSFSTTTWPSTIATNGILVSNATNTITALASSASSVFCTTSTTGAAWVSLGTGQMLIGSTGVTPVAGTITAGIGISVTNPSSTQINVGETVPTDANTSSINMTAGGIYLCDNGSSLITFTLPSSPAAGDFYQIIGRSSGGWTVAQNASQTIILPGGVSTTAGVSGSLSSNNADDGVYIIFTETANTFTAPRIAGNIIYV